VIKKEIHQLLCKPRQQLVEVRQSRLKGAGHGVFAASTVLEGSFLCLYPGIYTPPLPSHVMMIDDGSKYMANITAPSGGAIEENAYILNLQEVGGYLDGRAHVAGNINGQAWEEEEVPPTAVCGHLINHSVKEANVQVWSFRWSDVLDRQNQKELPNELRCDGSPWYFDGRSEEVVWFTKATQIPTLLSGAVLYATRTVFQEEELYLNYGLDAPYPVWAQGWYEGAS